jgi:uncharacterized membrane protein YkoI
MKTEFSILLAAMSIAAVSYGQIKVPANVTAAFNKKFPGASSVKWSKENAKEFEAEFKLNNNSVSANFGTDGAWTETETTINASELPAAVTSAIKTKYPGSTVTLSEKVEKPEKTYYEVELKANNKKKELEISPEGKFM